MLRSHDFKFDLNESINLTGREVFFKTKDEKDNFLRKLVKNEILVQLLDEKNQFEIVKELRINYQDRLSSLSKVRTEDKFGILANNFLSLIDPHASYFSARDLENCCLLYTSPSPRD